MTPAGAADCWGDNGLGQAADQTGPYRPYDPFELDNSPGQATEVAVGQTYRNNFIRSPGDVDYYTFEAEIGYRLIIEVEAQAIGSDLDPVVTLYAADGTTVLAENDDYGRLDSRIEFSVPGDGYYFLRVREFNDPGEGGPRHFYNLSLRIASLYFSTTKAGTTGGVAATPQDIIAYNRSTGQWSMLFDGSDVGVTQPLIAFARLVGGDWLLVFKANQTTPVGTFTPWDVARFSPTSLGDNTAGVFSWYFDGSDVGLTTAGEKIDALPDGSPLISTGGALAVPRPGGTLKAQDEDLTAFYPATLGPNTAGEWEAFFDGTPVPGMKGEDLAAAHYDLATGDIYAGITGAFKIGGFSGTGKQVLWLRPDTVPGGYNASIFPSGPHIGFNLLINGFEMD